MHILTQRLISSTRTYLTAVGAEFVARRTICWVDGGCIVSPNRKKLVYVGRKNLQDKKVDK